MIIGKKYWKKEIISGLANLSLKNGEEMEIYPETPTSIYESLVEASNRSGERVAIIDHDSDTYSFSDFLQLVNSFAMYLSEEKGLGQGDKIGVIMNNCIEYCVAFYAISKIRAVIVPIPSKYEKSEIRRLTLKANVNFVICEEHFERTVFFDWPRKHKLVISDKSLMVELASRKNIVNSSEKNCQPMNRLETCMIMFTSGTTSESKGVVLKNYNVMHAIESYKRILELGEKDITLLATPIYHITGLVAVLGVFIHIGGQVILHRKMDAKRMLADVSNKKVSFIHASPTVFHRLLEDKEELSEVHSLKSFACGSGNMPIDTLRKLHEWLPEVKFHTVYGLTETSSPATVFPSDAKTSEYIGSSGIPIPGTKFKVIDEMGAEVPNGSVGEIAIKGTVVLEEYYLINSDLLKEGWLRTGDIGYFNDKGYLYITDRKKNMINRGGEKIWSYDLENELISIEEVVDVAVVGIPDKMFGEVVSAAVKINRKIVDIESYLQEKLQGEIAKYKIPTYIIEVEQIPQTLNGKVDKRKVKELIIQEVKRREG